MAFNKLNSSNVFVLGLLFLCLVQAAYSRKCYMCLSLEDESCSFNPKQEKFMFDCDNAIYETNPLMKYLNIEGIINTTSNESNALDEMECANVDLESNVGNMVIRGCLPRSISCDYIRKFLKENVNEEVEITYCEQCFFDYCNSIPL